MQVTAYLVYTFHDLNLLIAFPFAQSLYFYWRTNHFAATAHSILQAVRNKCPHCPVDEYSTALKPWDGRHSNPVGVRVLRPLRVRDVRSTGEGQELGTRCLERGRQDEES